MTKEREKLKSLVTPAVAKNAIDMSAKFWFLTVVIGQAIFSYYILAVYYTAIAAQNTQDFNIVMPGGYVEGDVWGNIAVVAHVLFAAIITVGGLVQLIPAIRSKVPALHRWNGRLYILAAMTMSLSGAFMILTRSDVIVGNIFGHTTLMINGVIIIACAIMAVKRARQKQFVKHRVWALRLFIAVSGVWMFRIGMMAWITWHGRPVGIDTATFTGPFLTVLYTLVYVFPLLFLEVYLRVQARGSANQRLFTAVGVVLVSLIFAGGIFGATMGMWLPRIS
ncbi:DUF2306 domain-containing protein [Temperatibacter marinus]|uniref:DUF2306 domain-containing protein n=1 Tax=Temperatibacter marinus TaxID=1456591 RepID=A0AA52H866_9PROT|nr:DUF2306 domain-containing protein [Temperatibacter marinus]WND01806.1 DUF2306 domain-containing protein [Temperatibacter marinus]